MIEAAVFAGALAVTIVIVLALLSARMSATSHPTDREMQALTSSNPGERLIGYRTCNALVEDAVAEMRSPLIEALAPKDGAGAVSDALNSVSRAAGGLWVGGRAFLTNHRFVFLPNAVNRAVHKDLRPIAVDLKDVAFVTERFGIVTRIIDIKTTTGVLSIRALGASAFARQIRAQLGH